TRRASGIMAVCPDPLIEISPEDANRADVADGEWVSVKSRRGTLRARARVTNRVSEGTVFANFHFPGDGNANNLTIKALDPIAKIPEYKVCAVAVERSESASKTE
ncbi:MAG: hypothetical protein KDB27_28300, partial [Planctomycetales bacterium]|nr:hypothetical protein [Planctomycetales bacterium]